MAPLGCDGDLTSARLGRTKAQSSPTTNGTTRKKVQEAKAGETYFFKVANRADDKGRWSGALLPKTHHNTSGSAPFTRKNKSPNADFHSMSGGSGTRGEGNSCNSSSNGTNKSVIFIASS